MTSLALTRRTIALLAAGDPASPWWGMEAEVSSLIPNMLHALAENIASDPGRVGLLTQTYSVSLTNGVGDLLGTPGARTGLNDVLWQTVYHGTVLDADGKRLMPVRDLHAFQGELPAGFYYYHLTDSGRIWVRISNPPYALGNVSGPLAVTAAFVPVVGNLPIQLEDDAVARLAALAATKG